MYKKEIVLANEAGLHARPASLFIKEASKFSSNITVYKNGKEFNAKSIISILSMGAKKGDSITIQADGNDEKEAVEKLIDLVENNFYE